MAYVDTNVILAKYFPSDELHRDASYYLQRTVRKKFVSPVSVVELAAVVSRLQSELQAPKEFIGEPPKKRNRALIEFFIKDCNLLLASVPVHARMKIAKVAVSVPLEYSNSIGFAHALGLRTLDLIHLIYAFNLRRWGHDLDTFVTGDKAILTKADEIESNLEISVKEPAKAT
jgi:predicted nucleic acid-binding protein